jgi:hypothetical protein
MLHACTKSVDSATSVTGDPALLPLQAGNHWNYQDSIFDASGKVLAAYSDSSFISNQSVSYNGINFYAFNDSLGWFGASGYLGVDAANNALYELDSLNAPSPYLFFSLSPADGFLIGSSSYTDSTKNEFDALYGYAATFKINGYTCYKNIEQISDESGNVTYATVYYVSPGVGIVRVEEYSLAADNKTLYLDYSQTLRSYQVQ